MSKYIRAVVAAMAIEEKYGIPLGDLVDTFADIPAADIEQFPAADVEQFPAADVVKVVRCRECKYWGDESGKLPRSDGVLFARCKVHNYLLDGRHTGWCPTENDFCSYGERKEGVDNG